MKYKSSLFISVVVFFLVSSCLKKEEYPVIPAISFKDLKYNHFVNSIGGTVYLTISFTDGDGNIGLTAADTVAPYDYNLFVKLFGKKNGVFEEIIFPDTTLNFNARIPILNANGSNKTLKGDIEYKMDFLTKDTLQLEVFIKDRELNESNTITTPEFVIK
ncbi:MAG: hypothetical protein WCK02_07710 [Bacteroidota bacterium]